MKDQEIARRLRGFEAVWRRVRATERGAENGRPAVLMPRRKGGCRRRCR